MSKKYKIKSLVWMVKDEKSVRFHVNQDDYFGTIATIISLIKQQIKQSPESQNKKFNSTLNNLEKDLIWLQENYQITPRIKNKNKTPKGKEKNQ